jgi:hypothetical protein
MSDIVRILQDNGYKVVVGKDSVLKVIQDMADNEYDKLCSGWGVFPNGDKCPGCKDCEGLE